MFDVYVINLKDREDRWNKIIEIFGKDFNLIRVDAIKHEIGAYGCFLSHQKCIQIAKDKHLKYIIVIEDDCSKNNLFDLKVKIDNIVECLLKYKNWDIFTGTPNNLVGTNILKSVTYNKTKLYHINKTSTTNFIIYNSSSYDFYLNNTSFDPFKEALDNIWWHKLRAFTSIPFITYQYPCYSNIKKKEINYSRKFKKVELRIIKYISDNNIENYNVV